MKSIRDFVRKHDELSFIIAIIILFGTIAGSIYGYIHHAETKARNQAIARARQMDGRTFTIDNIAWNWIGDTKLILKDENGRDAGWIAMYMANPLNEKINPLSLVFTNPHGRIPLPMKVKAHFRPTPWTCKYDGEFKDNFTGSFLEFDIIG